MDVEVVKSDLAQDSVESGTEERSPLLHEKENEIVHQESEPVKFGSHGADEPAGRSINPRANFPKDAVDEWPEPKQIHSFYFVKYRAYEDPKLKAKLEQADKDIQKKAHARFQIIEKLRAKRSDRGQVISQMKPLNDENKQFRAMEDVKKKEMEPLQQALGKLRSTNIVSREKGIDLCSSEEELNTLIKSFQYRIQHESIPLSEEKQLLREIKQLEGTREKVIANAAMRARIQDAMGEHEYIQDQVKHMGVDLVGVRKEQQVIKAKLKPLSEEKKVIDKEIESLEEELNAISEKREKAYETSRELKKQREEGNTCFYQNRVVLNKARELAAKKEIEALKEMGSAEVEKFMSLWNNNKAFRDDYERRISPSLDNRQLIWDGRMRNPDEKPIVLPETSTSFETATLTKTSVKQPKENSISTPQNVKLLVEKAPKESKSKSQKEPKNKVTGSGTILEPINLEDKERISESDKLQKDLHPKQNEVNEAKLKGMKKEEEIAKAKQALERKKKLAEKAAAKAAIKAQKEAEKKLKETIEREKKAKKNAAASAPAPEPNKEQLTEADAEITEPEKAAENDEAPLPPKSKEQKENAIRYRSRPKGPNSLPKVILKRKKSSKYWVWAAPAALSAGLMLLGIAYNYFLLKT